MVPKIYLWITVTINFLYNLKISFMWKLHPNLLSQICKWFRESRRITNAFKFKRICHQAELFILFKAY